MNAKKKGFTLIELIIVIAILSIVLSAISSFFFTNYKTLNSVNKDLELQSQGEKAINFMVDNIIEGYGVLEVNGDSKIDPKIETEITKLLVKKEDNYASFFELKSGVLYYGKGILELTDPKIVIKGEADQVICNSIASIKVTPLPLGKSFSQCTGLRIKITMESDKTEKLGKVFVNEVYMRNKEVI